LGKTFPTGPTPVFPPNRWVCPKEMGGCGKEHSKPHFPHPKQLDPDKKPGEVGRVKFNRVKGDSELDPETKIVKKYVDKEGPTEDKDGNPNALFCPHCGYTHEGIILVKIPEGK